MSELNEKFIEGSIESKGNGLVDNRQEGNRLEVSVVPNGQYVKRKSFISKKNPYELSKVSKGEKPVTDMDLNLSVNPQDESNGIYEVVIKVDIKAKIQDEELFRVDIDYGGLFTIGNNDKVEDSIREQILMIHCPTLLFPYLRREVSTETLEGGYQPLLLNNIDFASIYKQQKQKNIITQ